MPLLSRREYTKKLPFRDATIYIVVCEGEKREPDYFRFFDGLSSQLKLVIIPSQEGKSAPNHLLDNAKNYEMIIKNDGGDYELWFILDYDHWHNQIHLIHNECNARTNWKMALSNPCFEVWLYYHLFNNPPLESNQNKCKTWKNSLSSKVFGGFNSNHHPIFISNAISNSLANYAENGFLPTVGGTQMHLIAEKIYNLTKKTIEKYRLMLSTSPD